MKNYRFLNIEIFCVLESRKNLGFFNIYRYICIFMTPLFWVAFLSIVSYVGTLSAYTLL